MSRREVPATTDLALVAPQVARRAEAVLAGMRLAGFKAKPFDTLRTAERQAFLFGKGRTAAQCELSGVDPKWAWPDCPDGIVTKAARIDLSMHGYGLAVDIVENDATPWIASQAFWGTLGTLARANGFVWGGGWKFLDLPHLQWANAPLKPTPEMMRLLAANNLIEVWRRFGAI